MSALTRIPSPRSPCFRRWRARVGGSAQLASISENLGWLLLDKFFRLGAGLLVGVWIARHLGVEFYGQWNYASSFAFLFGAFASLGIDQIVVRNLVQDPDQEGRILGAAFGIKLVGGGVAAILPVLGMWLFGKADAATIVLVAISSSCFLFQSLQVFDLLFQARSANKRTVIALNLAYLLATAGRIVLVVNHAGVFAFATMVAVEVVLGGAFLALSYRRFGNGSISWTLDLPLARRILAESWPLVLASSMSLLNMRIDQVFLGKMMDNSTVGFYSAAVRIAEIWLLVPAVFGQVLFPVIVSAKEKGEEEYRRRIFQIFRIMLALTIPVALGISVFADEIIALVYGPGFAGAGSILSIQIWTGAPSLFLFVFGQVFYVEKMVRTHLYAAVFQPISNICLNLLLIPRFGAQGAAVATMLTAFGSHLITMAILEHRLKFFSKCFRGGSSIG
jgi:PST family polysaccharide transporter